jgi:hypothetical protein
MPALKNQRHELFAQCLASGMSAAQAYREAGYVDNRRNASALKTNKDIVARVFELQTQKQDRFVHTRQCLVDALIENIEKALGRRPVKIGEEGREAYVYRGDVANRAIQLAGVQIGMFKEKSEVTIKTPYDNMTTAQLLAEIEREAQLAIGYDKMIDVTPSEESTA